MKQNRGSTLKAVGSLKTFHIQLMPFINTSFLQSTKLELYRVILFILQSIFLPQQNGDGKKTKKASGHQSGQHYLKQRNPAMNWSDVGVKRGAKQGVNAKQVGMNVPDYVIVQVIVVVYSNVWHWTGTETFELTPKDFIINWLV